MAESHDNDRDAATCPLSIGGIYCPLRAWHSGELDWLSQLQSQSSPRQLSALMGWGGDRLAARCHVDHPREPRLTTGGHYGFRGYGGLGEDGDNSDGDVDGDGPSGGGGGGTRNTDGSDEVQMLRSLKIPRARHPCGH